MRHIINRLQFEITCQGEQQALDMRQQAATGFQQQVVEIIEEVCDRCVPAGQQIRLDKLEIDLGNISSGIAAGEFSRLFQRRFEKQLLEMLAGISPQEKEQSAAAHAASVLQHFLLTGMLPWWADEAGDDFETLCTTAFAGGARLMRLFFEQQRQNKAIWQRAGLQLSAAAQQQLVLMLEPLAAPYRRLEAARAELLSRLVPVQEEDAQVAVELLEAYEAKTVSRLLAAAPDLLDAAAGNAGWTEPAAFYLHLFAAAPGAYELVKKILDNLPGELITAQGSRAEETVQPVPPLQTAAASTGADANAKPSGPADDPQAAPEAAAAVPEEMPERILVKQAGIVLLAPFLKPFFTGLELLDEAGWVSYSAQQRAVYLLGWLSTGDVRLPEYRLSLEKLLCGIPLHQPVEATEPLNDREAAEGQALLESVLEHWTKLKNTSVEGLRSSFLLREGIVTAKEDNWLVQVERKTLDVLLDSLPWSFSTIRTAWNNYIIFTEW